MLPISSLPIIPIHKCKCKSNCHREKCPCVNISIGTVETLAPESPAFVNIDKNPDACEYELSFGLPRGGAESTHTFVPFDGTGYTFIATDGTKLRGQLERKGTTDTFHWKFTVLE